MTARPDQPSALGNRVIATRDATRDLFGAVGVEAVLAALTADERAPFVGAPPKWVLERTYIAWTRAVYEGRPTATRRRSRAGSTASPTTASAPRGGC